MQFITRPFTESDRPGVIALWNEAFPDNSPWNIPDEDIDRKLKIQKELFIIAEYENNIIGSAMAGFDGHRGWVYYVAVLKKFRKHGVGEALMNHVERELAQIDCTKLNLQVRSTNTEVIEFYKKLGYNLEDRVSMGKRLNFEDK